jgi:UTP:GlnB (protein PII) uridylyltransferase
VLQVDSVRKRGLLLEAVQVLADLDLSINKAYISSDGRWFMDVFHVTDRLGRKLTDDSVITFIQQVERPSAIPSSALALAFRK